MRIITDKNIPNESDDKPDCDCDCACADTRKPTDYYVFYGGTCTRCGSYTCKTLPAGQGQVEEICKNCGHIVVLIEGN